MTEAIKLVPIAVGEYFRGFNREEIGIEISVGALICADIVYHLIGKLFPLGCGRFLNNVSHALDPFHNVGIPEDMRLVFHALAPVTLKRVKSSRFLETLVDVLHYGRTVEIHITSPKSARYLYLFHAQIFHFNSSL